MQFKRFMIYSAVLIAIVGVYTYVNIGGEFSLTIPFLDMNVSQTVALWVVFPLIVMFLLTSIHLMFAKVKDYFHKRRYQKDHKNLVEFIKRRVVDDEIDTDIKTKEYQELYFILRRAKMYPDVSSQRSGNEEMDELFEDISKVYSGEYIDLKKYHLPKKSDILKKNRLNRLKSDTKYAFEILKNQEEDEDLKLIAFENIIDNNHSKEIKKYIDIISKDKKRIFDILKLMFEKKLDVSFSNEELLGLIKNAKFQKDDLIELAKISKMYYLPDDWVKLFEYFSDNYEHAEDAYIYVLFDLEMIDRANERLINTSNDEMQKFKAYLSLKESGKHYPVELFV